MSVTSNKRMWKDSKEIATALGLKIVRDDIIRDDINYSLPRICIVMLDDKGNGWMYGPDWMRRKMRFERVKR